jgi:putative ABC transport system permease protein
VDTFFGVPTGWLALGSFGLASLALAGLGVRAWLWPVFFRLGVRQLPRRPAQTALIVAGLMLSTALVMASLSTGDTITHSLRAAAVAELGRLDEIITYDDPAASGGPAAAGGPLGPSTFFPADVYDRLAQRLAEEPAAARDVAGVAPVLWLDCTMLDLTSRQTSWASVVALPPGHAPVFGALTSETGEVLSLAALPPGEVYLNDSGRAAFGASGGDELGCTLSGVPLRWNVAAVAVPGGLGSGATATIFLPLGHLQTALGAAATGGVDGAINQIWVANHGDAITSAGRTSRVLALLGPLLGERDALAELQGLLARSDLRAAVAARRGTYSRRTEATLARVFELVDRQQPAARLVEPLQSGAVRTALLTAARNTGEEEVVGALRSALQRAVGYEVQPLKRQVLEFAEQAGNVIATVFLLFSLLSIAAGLLLVFLIFALLAAARRPELGTARALGTERGHLVAMFTFEGAAYAMLATAIGIPVGLAVTRLLVALLISGVESGSAGLTGVAVRVAETVTWHVEPRSIVLAASLGLLLTVATVAVAARRVSRVTIVTAMRDLPDLPGARGARRLPWWPAVLPLGVALVAFGLHLGETFPFAAGVSVIVLWLGRLVQAICQRWWGAARAARLGATLAGLGLAAYWALPFDAQTQFGLPRLSGGIEIFGLAGVLMIAGAVCALTANGDVVLGGLARALHALGAPAPAVRLAGAYLIRNPLRTGLTTTMFALVIFALTVMQVITAAALHFHGDPAVAYGGWNIRAQTVAAEPAGAAGAPPVGSSRAGAASPAPAAEPDREASGRAAAADVQAATGPPPPSPASVATPGAGPLPHELVAAATTDPALEPLIAAAGARTSAFFAVIQLSAPAPAWAGYTLAAVGEGFIQGSTLPLQARAPGYATDRAAWDAVAGDASLAIIDGFALPGPELRGRPSASSFTFQLHGVRDDQTTMSPTPVWIGNPTGPAAKKLTVIGVIDRRSASAFRGLHVSPSVLEALGPPIRPPATQFYFRLQPGADVAAARAALGTTFFEEGLQTTDLGERFVNQTGPLLLASRMLQLFVGLGLLVGLAALGVVSTRAALERRQAIGVLRAIGASRELVRGSLLLESAIVTLISGVLGVGLGLVLCRNVFAVQFFDRYQQGLRLAIPWDQLALTVAAPCAAALLATWLPATHASRIPPIAALREG